MALRQCKQASSKAPQGDPRASHKKGTVWWNAYQVQEASHVAPTLIVDTVLAKSAANQCYWLQYWRL